MASTSCVIATLLCLFSFSINKIVSFDYGSNLTDTNMFFSPKGKINSLMHLQYFDYKSLDLNCSGFENTQVSELTLNWPLYGLQKIQHNLSSVSSNLEKFPKKSLIYQNNLESYGIPPDQFMYHCLSREIMLNSKSVQNAYCLCGSRLSASGYCTIADSFFKQRFCAVESIDTTEIAKYCNKLKTEHISIASSCSNIKIGHIHISDLYLYPDTGSVVHNRDLVPSEIVSQELQTYYIAYMALRSYLNWVDKHLLCAASNVFSAEELDEMEFIIPHWVPVIYFYYTLWESPLKKIPIAVLAKREVSGDVQPGEFVVENYMLIIRDARILKEGKLAGTNRLTPISTLLGTGHVHAGCNVIASQIYPELEIYFGSLKIKETMQVTVIGEGQLGVGVGAIVESWLSSQFPKFADQSSLIKYNLIGFDGGSVGDAQFTLDLSKRVTIRNLISKYSSAYTHPCPSISACSDNFAFETGDPGQVIDGFYPFPGTVEMDMDKLLKPKSKTKYPQIFLSAQRYPCSALCWLTSKVCTDHSNKQCDWQSCELFF